MKKIVLTLALFAGFVLCLQAKAADIYVADTGSDATGNGSQDAPYATVTQALSVMASGDTIYCRGTIIDDITIPTAASGTASAYSQITNWPGYAATIDGGGAANDYVIKITTGTSYFNINGLNLTNANDGGVVGKGTEAGSNIIVSNNTIYNLVNTDDQSYIYLKNISNAEVSNNNIYGNGSDLSSVGIILEICPNSTVSYNQVHDFARFGVVISTNTYDSVVSNNYIYNIGGSDSDSRAGIYVTDTYNLKIYNNTLYNIYNETNVMPAIYLNEVDLDSHDITIINNIISTANIGIYSDGESIVGSSSDYNIFYNLNIVGYLGSDPYTTFTEWQTNAYQDAHGMEADPLFVSTNSVAYDFHLQASSPAIDAGLDTDEVTTDYDNESRPYNITDIGADELAVVAAPESLAATTAVKTAGVSWQMPEGYTATSYNIKLSANSDLSSATELSGDLTAMDLIDLSSASVYYFAVQAVYETDYASYSSDYSETSRFVTLPAKVKKVAIPAKFIGTNQAKIKWKKQNRVTGYQIKVMNAKGKKLKMVKVKTNKKYKIVKGLQPGRTYKIKVRARKTVSGVNYWGAWSKTKKFITLK
ncbi:MAG: fibronectin type III domain-containing protein [Patescibacteria group bacterium]|jgi:hypothetical protein